MANISPETAGALELATSPFLVCQIAPCVAPGRAYKTGEGVNTGGGNSSAFARGEREVAIAGPPPASRTVPSASRVAVCPVRAEIRSPTRVKTPVAGSYASAFQSPAVKTVPVESSVEVKERCAVMLPVRVKVVEAGS